LAEYECNLVAKKGRRILETPRQGLHRWYRGREIRRGGEIAQGEHGPVTLEKRQLGIQQRLL
jgi:hypothetical protein